MFELCDLLKKWKKKIINKLIGIQQNGICEFKMKKMITNNSLYSVNFELRQWNVLISNNSPKKTNIYTTDFQTTVLIFIIEIQELNISRCLFQAVSRESIILAFFNWVNLSRWFIWYTLCSLSSILTLFSKPEIARPCFPRLSSWILKDFFSSSYCSSCLDALYFQVANELYLKKQNHIVKLLITL